MKRYIYDLVKKDLAKKIIFITGPRQVGKTFLAKQLLNEYKHSQYLNYDEAHDLRIIRTKTWGLNTDLLIFDEIHKMKKWKNYLKGTFDTRAAEQSILVTGSARLDTFRQTGESLAGRYFHYRLNPFSVKELAGQRPAYEILEQLNTLGGFPEPFLSGSAEEAAKWRKQYYTDLVREDILEFSRIQEIKAIRLLLEMLRERVGAPLSFTALAEDLQIAPNTVRKYISILESLYIIFLIRPYHKNIARALLKEPKVYFYDTGYVKGDSGLKLENTCALCLLKHVQFLQDSAGKEIELNYLRTKDGKEIDFLINEQNSKFQVIEVKLSDYTPAKNLRWFLKTYGHLNNLTAVQLVHNLRQAQNIQNISIVPAGQWLAGLSA